jgi:hypothetical protein
MKRHTMLASLDVVLCFVLQVRQSAMTHKHAGVPQSVEVGAAELCRVVLPLLQQLSTAARAQELFLRVPQSRPCPYQA